MTKYFIFWALLLFISACSSNTQSITANNFALTSIFAAIENEMTMGIQGYSENHREFYSRYFLVKQDEQARERGYRERGQAKVYVLGDSRPYNIEAVVTIERTVLAKNASSNNAEYSFERHDKRLAKKLLTNIMNTLERRDRSQNLIDDFKPF